MRIFLMKAGGGWKDEPQKWATQNQWPLGVVGEMRTHR